MTRIGMVIGVRDDRIAEYRAVHADDHPGVRDLLAEANMHNFSIFVTRFPDGNHYLFGYYEYSGVDYDADMKNLGDHKRNKEWLAMTDPMQIPFPGHDSWRPMDQVYFNK